MRAPEPEPEAVGRAGPDAAAILAAAGDARVVHVAVTLARRRAMPSVRAYLVLAALGEHGEPMGSVPTGDDIEGFDGHVIEVWLATEHEDDVVAASAAGVPGRRRPSPSPS